MVTANDEPESAESEVRFEVALARLERIVESLQRGEPDLSEALAKYQEGVALLARCHGLLERAERSVAILAGIDDDGQPITTPFDDSATLEAEADPKAKPAKSPARRRGRSEPESD